MINLLRETKLPSIPSLDGIQDQTVRAALSAMKQIIELQAGVLPKADKLDQVVTYRKLLAAGVITQQWVNDNLGS
jgi:hypothetical protein